MTTRISHDAPRLGLGASTATPGAAVAIRRHVADLFAAGVADRAIKAGERAPAFELPDSYGNLVSSERLLEEGPLVVSFLGGDWCPRCDLELRAIETSAEAVRAEGASVVAISRRTPHSSWRSGREQGLSFPVLSDASGEVARAFGLRHAAPETLRAALRSVGVDVDAKADGCKTLPVPARYVVAETGVVAYAELDAVLRRGLDTAGLFPALRRLNTALAVA